MSVRRRSPWLFPLVTYDSCREAGLPTGARMRRSAWLMPWRQRCPPPRDGRPDRALAAGTAYQVDTGVVSSPGNCKVDAWTSFAANSKEYFSAAGADLRGRARPAGRAQRAVQPLPLRRRMDHRDFAQGEDQHRAGRRDRAMERRARGDRGLRCDRARARGFNFVVPATLRVTENIRINLNAGYLRALNPGRDFFSYGAGIDLRTPDNVWTVTGEVFGVWRGAGGRQARRAAAALAARPALSAGRRIQHRPDLRPQPAGRNARTGSRWRPRAVQGGQ